MEKRVLRQSLSRLVRGFYTSFYLKALKGMDSRKNCSVAKSATMERAYPKSIHIGDNSRISIEAMVLGHDFFRGKEQADTFIDHNTVIGTRAIVLPNLKIGNHVFVGAGAVVTKDIPGHCLVAGNSAKIIRVGIELNGQNHCNTFIHCLT